MERSLAGWQPETWGAFLRKTLPREAHPPPCVLAAWRGCLPPGWLPRDVADVQCELGHVLGLFRENWVYKFGHWIGLGTGTCRGLHHILGLSTGTTLKLI